MPTLVPRSAPRWFTDPIVDLLARASVTPNMLTVVGVAGNILAAVLAGSGEFLAAEYLFSPPARWTRWMGRSRGRRARQRISARFSMR